MQNHLIPLTDQEKKDQRQNMTKPYPVNPGNSGPAKLVIPDWYAEPTPTAEEFEAQRQLRHQALLKWQEANHRYSEQYPPPPIKWSNWPQAKEYDRNKKEALEPYAQALEQAGETYRRMICLIGMEERPCPPGSPSAVALAELKERLSQQPPLLTQEILPEP